MVKFVCVYICVNNVALLCDDQQRVEMQQSSSFGVGALTISQLLA